MTLTPLMRVLGLRDDGTVDNEVRLARAETARAAIAAIDGAGDDPMVALLRHKYQTRLDRSESSDRGLDGETPLEVAHHLIQVAERDKLIALRDKGTIGDDAFHRVEEELDWAELGAASLARRD
jgi:CPA1 family monovalent cation:H+ antiporter